MPDLTLSAPVDTLLQAASVAAFKAALALSNPTNDVQTKAAIVPNTVPAANGVLMGNVGGTAYELKTLVQARKILNGGVLNARVGVAETAADADYWIGTTLNNGAAIDYTVPLDSAFAVAPGEGMQIPLYQLGAGLVSVVAAVGVTILSRGGALDLAGQYAGAVLVHQAAANTWILVGDIAA